MTSPSSWLCILLLGAATGALTACSGSGGPLQLVFSSDRKLDGTDALNANRTTNIWLVKADGNGLTALTNATAAQVSSATPEWSANGSKIVFISSRKLDGTDALNLNATANVWKVDPNGTGLAALTIATAAGVDHEFPHWSPNGMSVVFDSNRKPDGTDAANINGTRNIWRVNADGTNLRPLTSATGIYADSRDPQWSPDGTKIAFNSSRRLDGTDVGALVVNLWRVNSDGTIVVPITRTTNTPNFDPQWSRDGTKVLFTSYRALDGTDASAVPPVSNLWQVNADGTGLLPLTNSTARGADNFSGQWAPDGSKIVFASTRKLDGSDAANTNSTANIWRVNSDGTGLMPLTRTTAMSAGSAGPRWSHDGTKVVFISARNPDGTDSQEPNFSVNIWFMNADGSGLRPITTSRSGALNTSPAFGP